MVDFDACCVARDHFDGLLDLWGYLCDRLFSRLDTTFTAAIDRLGVSLQRLWVVNNVVKGRMDAVDAFFTAHSKRLRPGDQDHSPDLDWTPWLSIGYIEVGVVSAGGRAPTVAWGLPGHREEQRRC